MASPLRKNRFFDPPEEELVGYLKKKILGELADWESEVITEVDMYGGGGGDRGSSIPPGRELFFPKDSYWGHFRWRYVPDPARPRCATDHEFVHVFTKLNADDESNRVVARCGTWQATTGREAVYHDGGGVSSSSRGGGGGVVIGYKRSFSFTFFAEAPRKWAKLKWSMVEYSINNPVAPGDYVLCKLFKTGVTVRNDAVWSACYRSFSLIHCSSSASGVGEPSGRQGPAPSIDDQRHVCFYTNCLVQNEEAFLGIDNGINNNCASASFVDRLGLPTTPLHHRHPQPPEQTRFRGVLIKVDRQVRLSFSIGDYTDEVVCDVVPNLGEADILLGRPWQYDRRVTHDGFTNKYHFVIDQVPFTLEPMNYDQMLYEIYARKIGPEIGVKRSRSCEDEDEDEI